MAIYTFTLRRKKYALGSLAECSDAYSRVRDELGFGASRLPPAPLSLDGSPIGYVAYNGRIFAGDPMAWKPSTEILYDNRI